MTPCKSFLFSKNGSSIPKQLVLIAFFIQKYIYIYIYIYIYMYIYFMFIVYYIYITYRAMLYMCHKIYDRGQDD